ncbi:MAG: cyclopropane fatty acyl phospholipid synthase [Bacteroidota bacterium]|nr:cyclopropane fatty acyl phospholipid synthase [Bacteroidota bacterium]
MYSQNAKKQIADLLSTAGISLNGQKPRDIKVHNEKFYSTVLAGGTLALGETYMEKWWDCERLDEFFAHVLNSNLENTIKKNPKIITKILLTKFFNLQKKSVVFSNAKHYNIGNDLFEKMLGKRMIYTCGYWKDASTLDEAQENKLDLVCKKLYLQPGMHILDIGCGWGGFAKFAAEKYSVKVTGITVSPEQVPLAKKTCEGLPVEIKLMDYKDVTGTFDRIVSLGMFEHVGHKNHRTYMQVADRCLKDEGLFLFHTIGNSVTRTYPEPWLNKYIFPNYNNPSITQIGQAIEGIFIVEDWHNFGTYYDKTLIAWYNNFVNNWDTLKEQYDERFFRMWSYYLLLCAGSFRAKRNMLWQIVLAKRQRSETYISVR